MKTTKKIKSPSRPKSAKKISNLVSVIVPFSQQNPISNESINSIINQTYRPIEIVFTCASGPSKLMTEAQRFIHKHNGLNGISWKLITAADNSPSSLVNAGLQECTGSMCTLLNSDEMMKASRVKDCVQLLKNSSNKIIITGVQCIDEENQKIAPIDSRIKKYSEAFQTACKAVDTAEACFLFPIQFTSGNLFFPRSLIKKIGEFADLNWFYDYDFLLRSISYGSAILNPKVSILKRLRRNDPLYSTSQIALKIKNEYCRVLEFNLLKSNRLPIKIKSFLIKPCAFLNEHNNFSSTLCLCYSMILAPLNEDQIVLKSQLGPHSFLSFDPNFKDLLRFNQMFHKLSLSHFKKITAQGPLKLQQKPQVQELVGIDKKELGSFFSLGVASASLIEKNDPIIAVFKDDQIICLMRAEQTSLNLNIIPMTGFSLHLRNTLNLKNLSYMEVLAEGNSLIVVQPQTSKRSASSSVKSKKISSKQKRVGFIEWIWLSETDEINVAGWCLIDGDIPYQLDLQIQEEIVNVKSDTIFREDLGKFLNTPEHKELAGFTFKVPLSFFKSKNNITKPLQVRVIANHGDLILTKEAPPVLSLLLG